MSAREFARLKGTERAAVIDATDQLFAERTGIKRRLDPDREKVLVKKWISIRDEIMRKGSPAGKRAVRRPVSRGTIGRVSGAMSAILPSVNDAFDTGASIARHLTSNTPWMRIARSQIGQTEFPGSGFNPQILQYILTCKGNFDTGTYTWADKHDWKKWVQEKRKAGLMIPDEKPTNQLKFLIDGDGRGANDEGFYWCAAFVNWCLGRAGIAGQNHGLVSKWKNWGTRLKDPHVGAILIMSRGTNSWGHIAFVDKVNGKWTRLGGNQRAKAGGPTNAVSQDTYPRKVTALIWPPGVKSPE